MNSNTPCPFCLPAVTEACFAESKNFRAVYNIAPILPGHVLIIPKKHQSSYMDLDDSLMLEMIQFSRNIVRFLKKVFKTDSFDWTLQEGEEAGQTVDHVHIHIIPRKNNDLPSPGDWYPKMVENSEELLDSLKRNRFLPQELSAIVSHLKVEFSRYMQ